MNEIDGASQIEKWGGMVTFAYVVRDHGSAGHRVVYNWSLPAFAELVTNAILHKDYHRSEHIGVYVYGDRITIVNHNRPLPPVTIGSLNADDSFDAREYVNPELGDMFFKLGLIESFGSGICTSTTRGADPESPDGLLRITLRYQGVGHPRGQREYYALTPKRSLEEMHGRSRACCWLRRF